ncbi:MAG: bacterial Ig-like domain-containing protein [Oscillospiraceae bacterium]
MGEAFRSGEVGLNIYPESGGPQYFGDHLEFWANGVPIENGYKFKEVGQKNITVKRYDKQASYQLQVIPKLNGTLKECSIATKPKKKTYEQFTEGFDPKDIVVKCTFTDGTTQNLGYKDLEFYAGKRDMKNYKAGNCIKDGYMFQEAGEKDLIVRVVNKEMRIPFTVTAFSDENIKSVDLLTEPKTLNYKVGEKFKAAEISLRITYKNGTVEDLKHNKLKFTANGTKVNSEYKFKEAGKKNVVVSWGDYEYKYAIKVS